MMQEIAKKGIFDLMNHVLTLANISATVFKGQRRIQNPVKYLRWSLL